MNRLEAAEKLTENQNPVRQFAIKQARQILQDAGVKDPGMPVVTSVEKQAVKTSETREIYPEISLEEEWQRQTQGFIRLGFHTKLGLTEENYSRRFPKFTPQPENFKGRLDAPVLVETRISPEDQCKLAGIQYFLGGLAKRDWNEKRKDYTTPKAPYAVWLEDGRNNLGKKPEDVRKNLKDDEIAGTELDGIALYISNPKILEHHSLDLPGTSVESALAAVLLLWDGRPRLSYRWIVDAFPKFGSVVRGRQK